MDDSLVKLKKHLILQHDEDDELLKGYISAAIDYAEGYQKIKYGEKALPPATEQAVIMLSCHFYESRDGGTGGFFADSVGAAAQVWTTVNRLLLINKTWVV